jgi:3-oxoacyl-[acyl-carrier protein] reductase
LVVLCALSWQLGYPVIINYCLTKLPLWKLKNIIQENGGTAELLKFDVSNAEQVDNAIMQWQENHSDDYIAVLVNNAGVREDTMMMWMQNEQWENIIGIHLNGFFYVTRRMLKDMLTKKFGRIINVVSLSGIKGLRDKQTTRCQSRHYWCYKSLGSRNWQKESYVNAVAPHLLLPI